MKEREKRRFLRISCEIESSFVELNGDAPAKPSFATVKDISRGGLRLRVDHFVSLPNQLQCHLSLPGHGEIEVRVEIAWTVELPHLGRYDIGARFVDASSEVQETIQDFEYETMLKEGIVD